MLIAGYRGYSGILNVQNKYWIFGPGYVDDLEMQGAYVVPWHPLTVEGGLRWLKGLDTGCLEF